MKLEELCAAVQEARYYNERFTRRECFGGKIKL